jgi:hypothetical protein
MTTIPYNDMPGELREKLKFWEVMNRILKNNGFIVADAINESIQDLKSKLNTALSDILGLEHDIDGVHNYDDGPLKNQIVELKRSLVDFVNDINNDINTFNNKLLGINATSSKLTLSNSHGVDAQVDVGGENFGARLLVSGVCQIYNNIVSFPVNWHLNDRLNCLTYRFVNPFIHLNL